MPRSKAYQRDEMVQKAMHQFWTKGYDATSIQDLVEATGLNRFSLYREFGNKEKLYQEAFKAYTHEVVHRNIDQLEKGSHLADIETFFLQSLALLKKAAQNEKAPQVCFLVLHATSTMQTSSSCRQNSQAILHRIQEGLIKVLTKAQENGEIPDDIKLKEKALYLVGCLYGLNVISHAKTTTELETYVKEVCHNITTA